MPMLEAGAATEEDICSVTQACPGRRGVVRHCMPTTSVAAGREVDAPPSLTFLQAAAVGLSLRAVGPRQCQPPCPGEPPRRVPLFVGSRDALDRATSSAPASAAVLSGTKPSEGLLEWGRRWLLSLHVSAAVRATTTWAGLPALEGDRLCRSGDVRVVVVAAATPVAPRAEPNAGDGIGSAARTGDEKPPFDFGVAVGELSRHADCTPPA